MGTQTRSAADSPSKKAATTKSFSTNTESDEEVLKVLLVPFALSAETRILSLKHPRDGTVKKFVFCPSNGLYEVTRIAAPRSEPRSTLFTQVQDQGVESKEQKHGTPQTGSPVSHGHVNKDATIFTATRFDLAFILLRLLMSVANAGRSAMFQPLDDILDETEIDQPHLRYLLRNGRRLVEDAMSRLCETVDGGDDIMYRYSDNKILQLVLEKANKVVRQGLPVSIEERFVTRVLEAPVSSIRHEEIVTTISPADQTEKVGSLATESLESQSDTATSTPSAVFSEVSSVTTITTIAEDTVPSDLRHLQRLRTALNFILASYVCQPLSGQLQQSFSGTESPVNFEELDKHLKQIQEIRSEALASRSFSDFSRKRSHADDEEAAETRAEKKRKQEEEEKKRKANESRGVRDLKKVNVAGMKKMSDFFAKAPAKKIKT